MGATRYSGYGINQVLRGQIAPSLPCYYSTRSSLLTRRHLLLLPWPLLAAPRPLSAPRGGWRLVADEQGLEQFAVGGPPCVVDPAPTRSVPRATTYKTGSPARRSLMRSEERRVGTESGCRERA